MRWAFCLQTMLKCADIGHLTLDLKTHKRWVSMLEEEFFTQVSWSRVVRQHFKISWLLVLSYQKSIAHANPSWLELVVCRLAPKMSHFQSALQEWIQLLQHVLSRLTPCRHGQNTASIWFHPSRATMMGMHAFRATKKRLKDCLLVPWWTGSRQMVWFVLR